MVFDAFGDCFMVCTNVNKWLTNMPGLGLVTWINKFAEN